MAVSNAQIVEFLLANPGMSDADIASVMSAYGIDPSQVAEATGSKVEDIQTRFEAVAPPSAPVYEPPPVYEPAPVYEPTVAPVAPVASVVTPVAPVAPVVATPVAKTSTEKVIDFLVSNPTANDAEIVTAMKTFGVSPAQLATATGMKEGEISARIAATVSPGSSVTLGDTVIVPQYRTTGSGMDEQVLGLESFATSKSNGDPNYKAPVGTPMQVYSADGQFVDTVKTKKDQSFFGGLVSALKDPVVLAAIGAVTAGATGLFSGAPAAGAASVAGAEAATAFELANAGIAGGAASFTPAQLALIEAGATAAEVAAAGTGAAGLLTGATPTATGGAASLTPAATAPTGATLKAGASSLLPTNVLTGATLGTTLLPAAVATGATSLLPAAVTATGTGLLTKAAESVIGKAVTGGLTTAGGLVQAQVSKEAAQAAQKRIDEETAAAKAAAQFRPVGMTTRFGTSEFKVDPKTGQLTSAGYTLSPEAKYAQDFFRTQANLGLQQVELAPAVYAPLKTGANMMFDLGQRALNQPTDARLGQIATGATRGRRN